MGNAERWGDLLAPCVCVGGLFAVEHTHVTGGLLKAAVGVVQPCVVEKVCGRWFETVGFHLL